MSRLLTLLVLALGLAACEGGQNSGEAPPIEMGDPATIVTETDTQYLTDIVPDLNLAPERPVTIASTEGDTTPSNDSAQTSGVIPSETITAGMGLRVPFPQVSFFVPGIDTKTYKEPNLEADYGASYELTEGTLVGNKVVIKAAEISAVYMRYQTIVVARDKLGTLPLESLRKLTDWKKIQGNNGVYDIKGLEPGKLQGIKVSNKAIRRAVSRDARRRNWTSSGVRQWQKLVRNTRSTSQKPLHIELRSVMWKVTGKDENGRPFTRQLRIDVPIAP